MSFAMTIFPTSSFPQRLANNILWAAACMQSQLMCRSVETFAMLSSLWVLSPFSNARPCHEWRLGIWMCLVFPRAPERITRSQQSTSAPSHLLVPVSWSYIFPSTSSNTLLDRLSCAATLWLRAHSWKNSQQDASGLWIPDSVHDVSLQYCPCSACSLVQLWILWPQIASIPHDPISRILLPRFRRGLQPNPSQNSEETWSYLQCCISCFSQNSLHVFLGFDIARFNMFSGLPFLNPPQQCVHLFNWKKMAARKQRKFMVLNRRRRLHLSLRMKLPLVSKSAKCFWCQQIWFGFFGSKFILPNNQPNATLWLRDTCVIVGILPLMIILITASLSSKMYNCASRWEELAFAATWSNLTTDQHYGYTSLSTWC